MSTGIRLSELVDLHTQSLTAEPGAFQLDVSGKGAKYRAIPAMEGLVDRINTYQGGTGYRLLTTGYSVSRALTGRDHGYSSN